MSLYRPLSRRLQRKDDELKVMMGENEKLYAIISNYLSLAQFELGRAVISQLFTLSPERVVHVLRAIALSQIPNKWLSSEQVPTGAHLAWLAYAEYRQLYQNVLKGRDGNVTPSNTNTNTTSDSDGDEKNDPAVIWKQLQKKNQQMPVNPIGFVNNNRVTVEVLEAVSLKIVPKAHLGSQPPLSYAVRLQLEDREETTTFRAVDGRSGDPQWQEKKSLEVMYADSVLLVKVLAKRTLRQRAVDSEFEDDVVGVAQLPLYQIRGKNEYHIWLPLAATEDLIGSESALLKNAGLSQVTKSTFGRVRLRVNWSRTTDQVGPGEMSFRVIQALETDLLISHAIYHGRKLYHGHFSHGYPHTRSVRTPTYGFHKGIADNYLLSGDYLIDSKPIFNEKLVDEYRQYTATLLAPPAGATLPELSDAFFAQLTALAWGVPALAYAICGKIAYLQRGSSLTRGSTNPHAALDGFFAQLIAEMLRRKEFGRAMHAAGAYAREVLLTGAPNVMRSRIIGTILSYIYDGIQGNTNRIHILLQQLEGAGREKVAFDRPPVPIDKSFTQRRAGFTITSLHSNNSTANTTNGTYAATSSSATTNNNNNNNNRFSTDSKGADSKEIELEVIAVEDAVRTHQAPLLMQSQAYSAFIGTPQEVAIKEFCSMEDQYQAGLSQQMDSAEIPECFHRLDRALSSLDRLVSSGGASASGLALSDVDAQRRQCLSSFHSEYYAYARVTGQHLFQFVIRKALAFCRVGNWPSANVIMRPFAELRPLVILLAWDDISGDFYAQEELIVNLWRNRPPFPDGTCREPRLIQWCERLDFSIRLVHAVADHEFQQHGTQLRRDEFNTLALKQMDMLRVHSVLYTFKDQLPIIAPTELIALLADPPQPDRGLECNHDAHVLRSFYAIHAVLGVLLGQVQDPLVPHPSYEQPRRLTFNAPGSDWEEIRPDHGSLSVLQSALYHITSMSLPEFKVCTLEKLFSLLFVQQEDVVLSEREARIKLLSEKLQELKQRQEAQMQELVSGDSADPVPLYDEDVVAQNESPLVLNHIPSLIPLLRFMQAAVTQVLRQLQQRAATRHSSHDSNHINRTSILLVHIEETLWRLYALQQKQIVPTLSLLSAPLEAISMVFLKLTSDEYREPNKLGDQTLSVKWRDLCALLRRDSIPNNQMYENIERWVLSFLQDEAVARVLETEAKRHLHAYLLLMDAAVVFHDRFIDDQKVLDNVVIAAQRQIAAARDALTEGDGPDLYNMLCALARHYENFQRTRFDIKLGFFTLGAEQQGAMGLWASSYRMSVRHKRKLLADFNAEYGGASGSSGDRANNGQLDDGSGGDGGGGGGGGGDHEDEAASPSRKAAVLNVKELLTPPAGSVDAGWLTSTTGRLEDQVPLAPRPMYSDVFFHFVQKVDVPLSLDETPWESHLAINHLMDMAVRSQHELQELQKTQRYEIQISPDASTVEKRADMGRRLARIRYRMTVLAQSLLPSLGALRQSLRRCPPENIALYTSVATRRSEFLPAYGRWVKWRANAWNNAHEIIRRGGETIVDGRNIRDLLAQEDVMHDQEAFVLLLRSFLSTNRSLPEKKVALKICDEMVGMDAEKLKPVQQLMQGLLMSIIETPDPPLGKKANRADIIDESFRAQCVWRLRDPSWAAQMTLKYIKRWQDKDLCVQILLKLLNTLSPSHPLRPGIAFHYNMILIFDELTQKFPRNRVDDFVTQRTKLKGTLSSHEQDLIYRIFETWQDFMRECFGDANIKADGDLALVLNIILDTKQTAIAVKLFEMYKKSKGLNESWLVPMTPDAESYVEDRIEAAQIADLMAPDPALRKRTTSGRIEAMHRLRGLQPSRTMRIVRFVSELIPDSQSRFLVLEYLRNFMKRNTYAFERKEMEKKGQLEDEYILGPPDDELALLRTELRAHLRNLHREDVDQDDEKIVVEDLEKRVREKMESLREANLQSMTQDDLRELRKKEKMIEESRSIVNPTAYKPEDIAWCAVSSLSTALLIAVKPEERHEFEKLFRNPLDLVRRLLERGQVEPLVKTIKYFKEYDGAQVDRYGEIIAYQGPALTEEEKKLGITEKPFNPVGFLLSFADEVFMLKHEKLSSDVAFAIYDLLVDQEDYVKVAAACLDSVNNMSTLLHNHSHALLVINLMKSAQTYFRIKLVPLLAVIRGEEDVQQLLIRFDKYNTLIFTEIEQAQLQNFLQGKNAQMPVPETARLPIMYALRRIPFSLEDLLDEERTKEMRLRLISADKYELAQRVYEELEHGSGTLDFQLDAVRTRAEAFDADDGSGLLQMRA